MENYVKYSLTGKPIKIKEGVVPHFFDCQKHRTLKKTTTPRSAFVNLNRKRDISEILRSDQCRDTNDEAVNDEKRKCEDRENGCSTEISPQSTSAHITLHSAGEPVDSTSTLQEHFQVLKVSDLIPMSDTPTIGATTANSINSDIVQVSDLLPQILDTPSICEYYGKEVTMTRSVGFQVKLKPSTRSKYTMCESPQTSDVACQTPRQEEVSRFVSPKKANLSNETFCSAITSESFSKGSCSGADLTFTSNSSENQELVKMMNDKRVSLMKDLISNNPRMYIGVDKSWMPLIEMLSIRTRCHNTHVLLTLMKIRLNDSFQRLGDQFGISVAQASRIFCLTVGPLAHFLKVLIYCPDHESRMKNMPIPFRCNFSNVAAIIDAFEIEIEKPTNPVHQALTWSDYKKANTLKYMISCTPDGFINFVSIGYGGRITDTLLSEECKIIDTLPEGCGVMADRGFKHIQNLLNRKKCTLIRPPSVSTSENNPTKEEVLLSKSIASLRIHIERVIRRIREFKILKPHSCVNNSLISYIDDCVIIAAGLSNLQDPVIRQ